MALYATLAWVAACSVEGVRSPAQSQLDCAPREFVQFGNERRVVDESPDSVNSILPAVLREQFDIIFYADTVDVNCDGTSEVVLYAREGAREGKLGGQVLGVFRLKNGRWQPLLMTEGVAEGVEQLALVADLSGDTLPDLVTIAADEGGYIPRAFKAVDGQGYVEVRVPAAYSLRHEAEWGAACMARINPKLVGNSRVSFLRETISPASDRGHGEHCDLPRDALRIVGDRMVPAD